MRLSFKYMAPAGFHAPPSKTSPRRHNTRMSAIKTEYKSYDHLFSKVILSKKSNPMLIAILCTFVLLEIVSVSFVQMSGCFATTGNCQKQYGMQYYLLG